MPYNTRRKSLSLTELGIILPKRSRAPSHPSPPSTINGEEPPSKRARTTSNGVASMSPPPAPHSDMSPPRKTSVRVKEEKRPAQLSPPPSPFREGESKVDTEGINDDVVIGTIEQLQNTGNRPHLVKELAAVLATSLLAVDKSANPCALISSRLTAFLNRPRPAFSPCPIAKLIEPVHPRRLYFHLTTMPRQPFPTTSLLTPQARITPSLSSVDDEYDEVPIEERPVRSRVELSPSPEVDLSSPELEEEEEESSADQSREPASPARSFPTQTTASQDRSLSPKDLSHNRRAVSPQLEPEERTFKQTANQMYAQAQIHRQNSLRDCEMEVEITRDNTIHMKDAIVVSVEPEETEEHTTLRNQEAAAELFEHADYLRKQATTIGLSSPMIIPQPPLHLDLNDITSLMPSARNDSVAGLSMMKDVEMKSMDIDVWDSLKSPENIALAELEDMFDDC